MDKITEQSEKHISSYLNSSCSLSKQNTNSMAHTRAFTGCSPQSTVYFSVTNKHPALTHAVVFLWLDSEVSSGSTSTELVLQNTYTCPSVSATKNKKWLWSSQRQQKGFSSSGMTQQTLLLGDTTRLTVQELFLQHSPKIVVLAQWAVSMLQHTNEDKWSRQGNNFFYGLHTQDQLPPMTPSSCNNVSVQSMLNSKGQSSNRSPQPDCLLCFMPTPTFRRTRELKHPKQAKPNYRAKNSSKSHCMSPIRSCFNTVGGKATNVYSLVR